MIWGRPGFMKCPKEETILACVRGALDEASLATVEAQLRGCTDCLAIVAGAARFLPAMNTVTSDQEDAAEPLPSLPATPEARHLLPAGSRIARYIVKEPLGAGSAGI